LLRLDASSPPMVLGEFCLSFVGRATMPQADLTSSIRERVLRLFAELNFGASEACRETILIREGNYCGRRFEAAEIR
jgi:hypothetical protein